MKSPITVLALMLLALASADSARDDSGPVEALEQRYREIMSKHKHGQIIDRELRDCARNASGGKNNLRLIPVFAQLLSIFLS